ncbi:hypothetical protein C8Q75DRAFT_550315 [Abortiporus biennis]|nr:hypothetical protein C8Q75DRAFT_550315 [Abortiporus biennis]
MSRSYIISFNQEATEDEIQKYLLEIKAAGGEILKTFEQLKEYVATIPDSILGSLQATAEGARVIDAIEPDSVVTIQSL